MSKLHQLHELGQSTWLNYMRRAFICSGELRRSIEDGIQGVTANAAVFQNSIAHHDDYDEAIQQQVRAGTPYREIHNALMADDVQRAADILHPIFESSAGLDGLASLELDPALADKAVETVAAAGHILARIDRGNAMVEIPATVAGYAAIRRLTADGVNINATHIFTVSSFERVAQAYINGLEDYFESHSVWRIAPTAVASFSVAAVDDAIDPILSAMRLADWQGQTGIALARLLYHRFLLIFSGPRWDGLARKGGRQLRPKWTGLLPQNQQYPVTYIAEALILPDTALTFTPDSLAAFQAHGAVAPASTSAWPEAQAHVDRLLAAGVDLDGTLQRLLAERLARSRTQYEALIQSVTQKLYAVAS